MSRTLFCRPTTNLCRRLFSPRQYYLSPFDTFLSPVTLCPKSICVRRLKSDKDFICWQKKISSNGKKNSFAGKGDFILWQKIFLSKVAIGYFALAFAWTQLQLLPRLICKHISILGWFGTGFKWLNFLRQQKVFR